MEKTTRFVGLDVHKATIAVAVADSFGDPEDHGQIANDPSAIRKLVDRLGGAGVHLSVAYEAGPTGYALHRQLTAMDIDCIVVAPSLIPTRPGDRVKTDRRDAAKLARLLRSGDLTPVWVPDEAHEALRDLVRDRDDAKQDLLRAKHRLSKFLLRHGIHPAAGVQAWGRTHEAWLNRLTLDHRADQLVGDRLSIDPPLTAVFVGRPIQALYVEGLCGGGLIPLGGVGTPRAKVHVPLAHQSALAGVLLAAALVRSRMTGGDPMTQVTRMDVRTRLGTHLRQPVAARSTGCVCRDLDYTDRYQTKWT
jgi:Transposase